MTDRRLLLWRHGRTAWNAQRRMQGHQDVPLDDVGCAEAARSAVLLAAEQPDLIVSSDLSRARDTAAALAELTGLPVRVDPRLRESNLGRWEGLTFDEVVARFPAEAARWRSGELDRRGGGEDQLEVAERAYAATLDADGATVVLVTHGGTARLLTGRLLGLPSAHWHALSVLGNCHWSELRAQRHGWRLDRHNVGPFPEARAAATTVDADEPDEVEDAEDRVGSAG